MKTTVLLHLESRVLLFYSGYRGGENGSSAGPKAEDDFRRLDGSGGPHSENRGTEDALQLKAGEPRVTVGHWFLPSVARRVGLKVPSGGPEIVILLARAEGWRVDEEDFWPAEHQCARRRRRHVRGAGEDVRFPSGLDRAVKPRAWGSWPSQPVAASGEMGCWGDPGWWLSALFCPREDRRLAPRNMYFTVQRTAAVRASQAVVTSAWKNARPVCLLSCPKNIFF